MKVHFGSATEQLFDYLEYYQTICESIKKLGHTITRDWLDEAVVVRKEHKSLNKAEIYDKTIQSILTSDIVIVEGSIPSFSVGHQVSVALEKNKPVLFLTNEKFEEEDSYQCVFINGINSPLLIERKYTRKNVESIIKEFIEEHKGGPSIRFNMFLTHEVDSYLDWANFTYGINKSEYIRRIIKEYMYQHDEKYKEYLKNNHLV